MAVTQPSLCYHILCGYIMCYSHLLCSHSWWECQVAKSGNNCSTYTKLIYPVFHMGTNFSSSQQPCVAVQFLQQCDTCVNRPREVNRIAQGYRAHELKERHPWNKLTRHSFSLGKGEHVIRKVLYVRPALWCNRLIILHLWHQHHI